MIGSLHFFGVVKLKKCFHSSSFSKLILIVGLVLISLNFIVPTKAWSIPIPRIQIGIDNSEKPEDVAITLQVLFVLTILSLAPALLIMTTSFTRIIIVLSFLRRALGTQQTPPNQILAGLALFMTFFIMGPVWEEINSTALQPYLNNEIQPIEKKIEVNGEMKTERILPFNIALQRALVPIRKFMWQQIGVTGAKDIALFINLANLPRPNNADDVPMKVLMPAFVLSELRKAFVIGFVIFVPFLVIDMVTASVLMSMGMMMLPPVMISLPFKILLFVMVDGWNLLAQSLGAGFVPFQ